ncbi:C-reactive protein [Peromyscus leucopus]|uniref:C-reactive protein n=1 Tax=Peromyscus leucopus TaxID=10041 RepID=UPI0010A16E3C|nr:C-reactive protein [Peromyscus leucopus]
MQIPAASTAMEKLLWCSLIMISLSQAFVQKDMSRMAIVFPKESDNSYVTLDALSKKPLKAFTVCLHIFTDMSTTRSFSIFSYATKNNPNDILIFWTKDKGYIFGVGGPEVLFKASEIPEAPTHLCASWESATGIVELWVDGRPKVRKSLQKGYTVATDASIILGQEQDSYGGTFDAKQSFVGDIGDVNMWDTVLSPEQINTIYVGGTFSPNVLNWQALKYKVQGDVVMKPQLWS